MRIKLAGLISALALCASPLMAQDRLEGEIATALIASFGVFDANSDGKADVGEVIAGAKSVFAAVDADGSGAADQGEFQLFSMGLATLAETKSQKAAYQIKRAAIFTRWDANADGQLSEQEVTLALISELFAAADASVTADQYGKSAFITDMAEALK
jgi:Ca2+-binding EF-hand superfamily protein